MIFELPLVICISIARVVFFSMNVPYLNVTTSRITTYWAFFQQDLIYRRPLTNKCTKFLSCYKFEDRFSQ